MAAPAVVVLDASAVLEILLPDSSKKFEMAAELVDQVSARSPASNLYQPPAQRHQRQLRLVPCPQLLLHVIEMRPHRAR